MSSDALTTREPAQLYADIQQFYAYQMGLLDDGAVDAWTATFADDAAFEDNTSPEPLLGRDAIHTSVRGRVDQLEAERRQFRHWFGMLEVNPRPDGTLDTRVYALAMSTQAGASLRIHGHVVCRDHLVPHGAAWRVQRRQVEVDGV
jgi:3-phenylpropionate/cinnamic acid dioxygenase small subunit